MCVPVSACTFRGKQRWEGVQGRVLHLSMLLPQSGSPIESLPGEQQCHYC